MNALAWQNISTAISHYINKGYSYQDVPWFVDSEINSITFPTRNSMVGSAEQGFLDLAIRQNLVSGPLCSCTPCYRDETRITPIHFQYFMKVELFELCSTVEQAQQCVEHISQCAFEFFQTMTDLSLTIVQTNIGHDIELQGIEIGSYGWRQHEDIIWAYGTGLAEPRFSIANRKID